MTDDEEKNSVDLISGKEADFHFPLITTWIFVRHSIYLNDRMNPTSLLLPCRGVSAVHVVKVGTWFDYTSALAPAMKLRITSWQ